MMASRPGRYTFAVLVLREADRAPVFSTAVPFESLPGYD